MWRECDPKKLIRHKMLYSYRPIAVSEKAPILSSEIGTIVVVLTFCEKIVTLVNAVLIPKSAAQVKGNNILRVLIVRLLER